MTRRRRLQVEALEARDVPSAMGQAILWWAGTLHPPKSIGHTPFGGPGSHSGNPAVVGPVAATGHHVTLGGLAPGGGDPVKGGQPGPFGGPGGHSGNPAVV
jgi:hypothetical protein